MEIVLFKFRISNRAFGQTCEDDFFKATNKNKDISNDPFFSLDPLRKQ